MYLAFENGSSTVRISMPRIDESRNPTVDDIPEGQANGEFHA
jgi:hypothetical protein